MSAAAGSLEVLRAAHRAAVPWKNGGGLTREVAAGPPGSDLAGFDWRVSIAEIATPGPFSLFPGIDRRMAVLSGRLALAIGDRPAADLTPESGAVAFPGEAPVFAEPLGVPVTDLNVMARRSRCAATLTRKSAPEAPLPEPRGNVTLLVALVDLIICSEGTELALSRLDALKLGRGVRCTISARSGEADYYLIEIF